MLIHLDVVAVEFEFGAIKQRLVSGKPGDNLVNRLYKVDDVEHCSIRHTCRYIARNRVFERGTNVGKTEFALPSALAVEDIAVSLDIIESG